MRRSRIVFAVLFVWLSLVFTSHGQSNAWDVAVLDKILANVRPGQTVAQVGDMFISVSALQASRDALACGPRPLLAFDGGFHAWTSGTVFYSFSNNVPTAHQKAFVDGMNEWAMFANLHYVARTTQSNYVTIVDGGVSQEGGDSNVGMIGGQQFIHIGSTSWNRPTVCHEFGHTLGLIHEQQRSDRDSFVTILTNNIIPGQEGNFVKLTNSLNETAYDFLSIMHYSRNALSISTNLDTIEPLTNFVQYINIMGQQFDPVLSVSDRTGMALVYGPPTTAVTNIVTNTQDSGPGSLRAAMYFAFDHPGTTIRFNIPTSDPGFSNSVFNILPTGALLSLVNGMIIDGSTEPTNSNPNGPEIMLNGSLLNNGPVFANGLHMTGSNCVAQSLVINGFNESGVAIEGSNAVGNVVAGCYIGIDPSGTVPVTNHNYNVLIDSAAHSNIVGGTTMSARNVISGSASYAIIISGTGAVGNVLLGNYIGLNATGMAALPNAAGIRIDTGASFNIIGGVTANARNVISGNNAQGIVIFDPGTDGNIIEGNYIGLNAAGNAAISNKFAGIEINGGPQSNLVGGLAPGAGNILSGNNTQGLFMNGLNTAANIVEGNFIGTDPLGISAIGNRFAGIEINGGAQSNVIGGVAAGAGNVISGNGIQGIHIDGLGTDANLVQGNFIGVNVTGAAPLGNGGSGIELCCGSRSNVFGGTISSAGNLVSGNSNYGIVLGGVGTDGTVIQGNLIGTDISGTSSLANVFDGVLVYGGAQHTQIGGNLPGMRNIISGNLGSGVSVFDPGTQNNFVQGNFLGLNVAGNVALGNGGAGVVIGGECSSNTVGGGVGSRNIISGNVNSGVIIQNTNTTANFVTGNTIGLDATSTQPIPNQNAGVTVVDAAQLNVIGGTTLGSANLIASNSFGGVELFNTGTTNNSVLGNSIFGNGINGLGLNGSANNLRNAPSITSAVLGTNLVVSGSLNSSSNAMFRIEFFASPAGSVGQGKTFLGAINPATGSGGTVTFSAGLASTVPVGQLITATATDPQGNTSPFSNVGTVTTTDSVGDGIPDAWRAAFFGGSGNSTNGSSCATCDPDHDGFTNFQEFHAGTNPQTNSSAFRVISAKKSGSDVLVTFSSVAGKIYRIEEKDDMALAMWTLLIDQVAGTGSPIAITDPGAATLPKRFYRVDVLP